MSNYLMSDNVVFANARMRATHTSGQSIPSGAATTLVYNVEKYDNNSNYDPSTGIYTVPADGVYSVNAACILTGSSGSGLSLFIYRNAVAVSRKVTSDDSGSKSIESTIEAVAGDEITIRLLQTSGASRTITTTEVYNHFDIFRVSDYSAGQPVRFGVASDGNYGLVQLGAGVSPTIEEAAGGSNGLIPYYNTTTVVLNNEFTGGNRTVTVERIGNTVTLTGQGVATHSGNSSPDSSSGLLPTWARPSDTVTNLYYLENTNLGMVRVTAAGLVGCTYNTYTANVPSNRGSTALPINITYVIT